MLTGHAPSWPVIRFRKVRFCLLNDGARQNASICKSDRRSACPTLLSQGQAGMPVRPDLSPQALKPESQVHQRLHVAGFKFAPGCFYVRQQISAAKPKRDVFGQEIIQSAAKGQGWCQVGIRPIQAIFLGKPRIDNSCSRAKMPPKASVRFRQFIILERKKHRGLFQCAGIDPSIFFHFHLLMIC